MVNIPLESEPTLHAADEDSKIQKDLVVEAKAVGDFTWWRKDLDSYIGTGIVRTFSNESMGAF